ncbi:MAG: Nre family DNA repair protein [archaeon]
MDVLCIKCKGKGLCGQSCKILNKFINNAPKPRLHFSGKSAPEIFIGRIGYPHINSGILVPPKNDNVSNFATAEEWSANNFSVANVLRLRSQLVYGKSKTNIKLKAKGYRLKALLQELALSSKPVSTEIFLKKKPTMEFTSDSIFRPMINPAPIKKAILEENPKVPKKVDYLTSDYDTKATTAIKELYASNIKVDHLQRLLSVGLLGTRTKRKMVPTRWSITATDDTISKQQLEKIRYFPEINQVTLFSGNFIGNYIEAILLPGHFSFEAIEAWLPSSTYNSLPTTHYPLPTISQDYETFNGRKKYAFEVTGGYYAMRLPTTEYLTKIKRQAIVLIFREIKPEYYAPLGVGIVREATRRAFSTTPKYFENTDDALKNIQTRIAVPIEQIKQKSWTLKNYGKQKTLKQFL